MKVATGPDFVCVGAQKAGTTWLFDNLAAHPDIWLPPVKELHFFNLICPNEELLGIEADQIPKGLGKVKQLCAQRSLSDLRWILRYYDSHRTTSWYRGLFDDFSKNFVTGDITPAYSTLDERGVAFAKKVLDPNCRIFVILRNPVERIWSGVKMSYRWQGVSASSIGIDQIIDDMRRPENRLRTDYPGLLQRWAGTFGERFKIFLYDDLVANPETFLRSVEQFIGVPEFVDSRLISQRSNSDVKGVRIPEELNARLVDFYREDVKLLEGWLPGLTGRWREFQG